jgi:UDP-glucose-4-epimerase GalE
VRSVLVTGGAGYVGAHCCKALRTAGYLPVVVDNLSTGHENFVRWGPLVRADIRDTAALVDVFHTYSASAVLHFAASAYVGESVIDPQKYYENNVIGALSLLGAMRQAGCRNVVFSSTCAVYGEPERIPLTEATPQNPVNPYGASKAMIERILKDYARAYGLRFVALRYFNACGADPEGALGELRDPETHLIPRAMMALQGYIDDFTVFGTDYATPDGTPIRDYIHVADLASAHVASLKRLLAGGEGGAFNLGTGRGYSVQQVLNEIGTATGELLEPKPGARRPGDPAVLVADATLANKELGFVPAQSDLKTIIATAWAWHQRAHPKRTEKIAASEHALRHMGRLGFE